MFSYHGQKLIQQIKDDVSSQNLILINNELQYIRDTDQMQKSLDIICSLINIVGNYLVTAEKQNRPDDYAIFDTFCCLDFMSQFLELSNYDEYKINLQLIKTLSFLLINIKSKPTLYYLFSNNLLNKIISKDYSKYDDEFLSYYVNFLKSLSLLLDETSIQLFYLEKNNSFPLVENIIKFYNHKDSMIRNVVRNTIMNILRVKNCKIEEHFSKLPALLYFVKVVFHIKNYCLQIKEEIKNKNNKKLSYLFDDLYDELIYIDDLLNLKIEKINYILINCLFYFLILPVLCGSICNENKKAVSKELAMFLLIFFFVNMKNETFKNCLFSLLFLDEYTVEIEKLLKLNMDINDFFINNININQEKTKNDDVLDKNNNQTSFFQFFSEHYSYTFLLTIIQNNNIIYNKYGKLYPQLGKIMENGSTLSNDITYGENCKNFSFEEIVKKLKLLIHKYLDKDELDNMKNYHEYLSKATGLLIGELNKENINSKEKEELICENCFMFYIRDLFHYLSGNNKKNIKLIKNKIKENIFNYINYRKEDILLLFNLLLFIVQNNEINISKTLLKYVGLQNIFDNTTTFIKKLVNIDINSSINSNINIIEHKISFNKNIFTFNNYFFSMAKIDTNNKMNNNNNLYESLSNLLVLEIPFLPITYQVIYQNIINLILDENYCCHVDISDKFIQNIESKYKSVLFFIYSLFKNESKNRENSYEIFKNKWLFYKDMNNKTLIKFIKKNIISSIDILTMPNIDANSDFFDEFEIYHNSNLNRNQNDSEIFLKSKKENVCFETNIFIFMLMYDLKKIFVTKKNNVKASNDNLELIKTKFPLDYSKYEFQIGNKYDIDTMDSSRIYKHQILYKVIGQKKDGEKSFLTCEVFFYRSFLYFGLRNKEDNNNVLIFKKIDIKAIEANKDYNKNEGDNCVQLKVDDGKNEIIIIKFENKMTRKEFKELINEKIMTSSNDERLLFSHYFEKLISNFKSGDSLNNNKEEEDF